MTEKRTIEQVKEVVNNLGFVFLEDYYGSVGRRVIIQDKIGYKYDLFLASFIKNHDACRPINNYNPFVLENIPLWLKEHNKTFELCEHNEYKGNKVKLSFHCLIPECHEIFYTKWNSIVDGNGCPYCDNKKVGKHNSILYLRSDLVDEWDYERNELRPENVTPGSNKKVWWICKKCNYNWETSIKTRSRGRGCPKCKSPRGEKRIFSWIKENYLNLSDIGIINCTPQKKFPDCKNILELPFDFGLQLQDDSWFMIEYYGDQHYAPNEFFGGKEQFKLQKKLDKIKQKYCKGNTIPLLIIPYWEFDNIEKILTDILLH